MLPKPFDPTVMNDTSAHEISRSAASRGLFQLSPLMKGFCICQASVCCLISSSYALPAVQDDANASRTRCWRRLSSHMYLTFPATVVSRWLIKALYFVGPTMSEE